MEVIVGRARLIIAENLKGQPLAKSARSVKKTISFQKQLTNAC